MNKELTEAELQAIRDEAEKLYPTTTIKYNWLDVPQFNKREGYIAALTAERQRSKALVEAAKELHHLHMCEQEGLLSGKPTPLQWLTAVDNLSNALSNYQNKTP